MVRLRNALVGLLAAVFFSFLYLPGVTGSLDEQIYDLFLHFRAKRDRIDSVVFLDVDDNAIAYNGVFPWPRSITADGLLRLKEYGARAAIFDIEFIDKGPQGIDSIYFRQGLPADFNRSFAELSSTAQDIFSAMKAGRIRGADLDEYGQEFSTRVRRVQNGLYAKAQGIVRDNDLYLAQSLRLFGRSWLTLNLRASPLEGEQAERRFLAEERFSWPVKAAPDAHTGGFVDILPALPSFTEVSEGAGFTNVEIDDDGIRRRIYLTHNIYDHWYLQLAFAPLVNYLGRPDIELERGRLILRGAEMPAGKKDVVIPLDGGGRMMLDWPAEDYYDSYRHISFADFSLLEDIEAEIEQYSRALGSTDIPFFAQFDPSLAGIFRLSGNLSALFDEIHELKNAALETGSDDLFDGWFDGRARSRVLIRELLGLNAEGILSALVPRLAREFPGSAETIIEEAEYIATLLDYLEIDIDRYEELTARLDGAVRDKFCILGRVDTGTTDIGSNPFWGEYVNVGTHAVILDTILSESFITPLNQWWSIAVALILVPLFFLFSGNFAPVTRTIAGFSAMAVVLFISLLLFRLTGIFFGPMGTVLSMTSAVIIREILSYAGSEREKQFIRKAFSTYVSDDVVKEIIADPSRLQLGGTKRHMSAIFTDVQGFSTISEQLDPEELVSLLNRYLTTMSDVVLDEKGTIDKYEGDAIIAFFGAPLPREDHALRACVSAIAMKKVERELNQTIIEQKLSPTPLLTRIGINTGSMVAGNMGTENKMNYTIMGNAVNLAARLEGVNKQYGTWIIAAEDTIRETGGVLLTRRLDRVRVVGIREPVALYEILDTLENASPEQKKLVSVFHEALDAFGERDWKRAGEGFGEVLSMEQGVGPAAKYIDRCKTFLAAPPKDTWDGVFNLTEK